MFLLLVLVLELILVCSISCISRNCARVRLLMYSYLYILVTHGSMEEHIFCMNLIPCINKAYVCMYVCMYVWMYVCMDGWMDVCMYVCMYVCTDVRTYVRSTRKSNAMKARA